MNATAKSTSCRNLNENKDNEKILKDEKKRKSDKCSISHKEYDSTTWNKAPSHQQYCLCPHTRLLSKQLNRCFNHQMVIEKRVGTGIKWFTNKYIDQIGDKKYRETYAT